MTSRREAFDVTRPQTLEVRLPSGQLEVRADNGEQVTVQIDGRHSGDFEVSQAGSTVVVQHEGRRGFTSSSHDVIITAPPGSRLNARVASADITTDGVFGEITLATASGDAYIGSQVDGLDAKTASGRLQVERCEGPVRIRTASGRVHVMEATRDTSVTTASGDVLIGAAGGDVVGKTASGRVEVERFDGESCNLKTVSGGVKVGVPRGRTVQVDLQSLSGRIDLPSDPENGRAKSDRSLRVKAKTVSGNIIIDTVED